MSATVHAGRQNGGNDVTVAAQTAVRAVVGALGQCLRGTRAPHRQCWESAVDPVLARRQCAAGGGALGGQRRDEHAGAEQRDPFAPQPRPGPDLVSSTVMVLPWAATIRAATSPARACLAYWRCGTRRRYQSVCADSARELVVAVGAQRHPIGAGMPRPAGVGDLAGRRPFIGAVLGAFVLAHRGAVLVRIGVAPGAIQRLMPGPGFLAAGARPLLLRCAAEPLGDQPTRLLIGERRH